MDVYYAVGTESFKVIRVNFRLRNTVERRLAERQSSETSNIRTHIFFVLRSNNEKSAITSRNKVLCHFY